MLLAQWFPSSEAAFAAAIVAFLLLLAVDLLSAPACVVSDELPDAGDAGTARTDRSTRKVVPNR